MLGKQLVHRHAHLLLWNCNTLLALPCAALLLPAGEAERAWQLYLQQQQQGGPVLQLLHLIANDCYSSGAFLWAARAFDALEFLEAQQAPAGGAAGGGAVWDGKRGACVAVFQAVTKGELELEVLRWVLGAHALLVASALALLPRRRLQTDVCCT